jgi:hypothetical protein
MEEINIEKEEVAKETTEEITPSDLFEINLDKFLDELSALNDTLPTQMMLLDLKQDQLFKQLEKIAVIKEDVNEVGKPIIRYQVTDDGLDKFPKIHKHLKRTEIAQKILPRNFIVSIISQYDAFLGETVRVLYDINPNLIRSSEKEIQIEDLFKYESIDELKYHIVDKEVDSLLREEHLEQFKVLERRITKVFDKEFTLTKGLPVLKEFIELTQRRNLFVHTNGLTTRQYVEIKKKWKFKTECDSSLNQELLANAEYCNRAYEILYEIAVKLTHVLWRKFLPDFIEQADTNLNQTLFDLLNDNKYQLAVTIANFGTDVIKHYSSEQVRKFIIINKAIAYKMIDEEEECQNVIQKEDWSIGNEFKLAKAVLENDYETAKKIMLKVGPEDELISKKAYKEWPLFKKFRKTDEFKNTFFELFNEKFSLEEIQDKENVEKSKNRQPENEDEDEEK